MKLVKGSALDWQRTRELLGQASHEFAVPDALVELEAMTLSDDPDLLPAETDWPMIDIEGANENVREVAAVVTEMVVRHRTFESLPVGLWNHPISMTDQAIGQVLKSLGYPKPEHQSTNAVGRVLSWP